MPSLRERRGGKKKEPYMFLFNIGFRSYCGGSGMDALSGEWTAYTHSPSHTTEPRREMTQIVMGTFLSGFTDGVWVGDYSWVGGCPSGVCCSHPVLMVLHFGRERVAPFASRPGLTGQDRAGLDWTGGVAGRE